MPPNVLIVDDEPDIRELLAMTLERMKLAPRTAEDLAAARRELGKGRVDLCLTDMRLPDGNGLDLVEWMQTHTPGTPVAVITAHGNVESAVRALKLGAFDFVSKPLDLQQLRKLVSTALKLHDAEPREQAAQPENRLLGGSRAMRELRELVSKVARSQAPVHICGESGTGKELVARLIHESGARRDQAFVPINCGAIPTELMESEFFGHKKGSFTGAVADKEGLFQVAEGGTLLLDEIADLPLHMQVKLLRVIQEKTLRPVGAAREFPVDVRILSATHRNLAELVAAGRFREDLFYRINVIELRVPPLRERLPDIPALAASIVERLAGRMGLEAPALSDEALSVLAKYHYPGNVRELENVLERALALSGGHAVEAADIQIRGGSAPPVEARDEAAPGPLGSQLEDVEREAILKALEQTRYNKTAAARLLGISFRALRYRIKKLGLE
ncbi:MAG: sigma-54-dependent Fis family transcriptional regulator [Gammaproteobacteria bacterium]|nr:sigma-54-dependent Fis family transcriptional regulator [Gammaproteobacteria bacterium]